MQRTDVLKSRLLPRLFESTIKCIKKYTSYERAKQTRPESFFVKHILFITAMALPHHMPSEGREEDSADPLDALLDSYSAQAQAETAQTQRRCVHVCVCAYVRVFICGCASLKSSISNSANVTLLSLGMLMPCRKVVRPLPLHALPKALHSRCRRTTRA